MADRFLLDTNVVAGALRGDAPRAVARLARTPRDRVAISVVTAMELHYGIAKNPGFRSRAIVESFIRTVRVEPLPADVSETYGTLRATLARKGRPIGPLDTIIAAHAIYLGAVLVTNNAREFGRVEGLRCENWSG